MKALPIAILLTVSVLSAFAWKVSQSPSVHEDGPPPEAPLGVEDPTPTIAPPTVPTTRTEVPVEPDPVTTPGDTIPDDGALPVAGSGPEAPLDLEEYRGLVAEGRLEGVVLSRFEPRNGVRVELWDAALVEGEDLRSVAPGTWSTTTDPDGTFRFDGLLAGKYMLRAELAPTVRRELRVEMRAGLGSKRMVIRLGGAEVTGFVHDEAGDPISGALVTSSLLGGVIGGEGRLTRTWTEVDGSYRLGGLEAGRYWISTHHDGHGRGSATEQFQIELGENEERELTFGPPQAAHWAGTLVDGRGEPVKGARMILLRERETGIERRFLCDLNGRFFERVPTGEYDVEVGFQNQTMITCAPLAMGEEDVRTDLEVPVGRVRVRITNLTPDANPLALAAAVAAELRVVSNGDDASFEPRRAEIPTGEDLFFFGLPEGSYRFELGERFELGAGGQATFGVTADDPNPGVHLVVRER